MVSSTSTSTSRAGGSRAPALASKAARAAMPVTQTDIRADTRNLRPYIAGTQLVDPPCPLIIQNVVTKFFLENGPMGGHHPPQGPAPAVPQGPGSTPQGPGSGRIDVRRLVASVPAMALDQSAFSAARLRIQDARGWYATLLLFKSGKCVCTGAPCETSALAVVRSAMLMMQRLGFPLWARDHSIKNVVCHTSIDGTLPLSELFAYATRSQFDCAYDPATFPGMTLRTNIVSESRVTGKNTRVCVTFLIFSTGRVVIVGPSEKKFGAEAFYYVYNRLLQPFRISGVSARSQPAMDDEATENKTRALEDLLISQIVSALDEPADPEPIDPGPSPGQNPGPGNAQQESDAAQLKRKHILTSGAPPAKRAPGTGTGAAKTLASAPAPVLPVPLPPLARPAREIRARVKTKALADRDRRKQARKDDKIDMKDREFAERKKQSAAWAEAMGLVVAI
jgi:TATA-box binding protein (TBP) (component of TFIID and TFIIIB)